MSKTLFQRYVLESAIGKGLETSQVLESLGTRERSRLITCIADLVEAKKKVPKSKAKKRKAWIEARVQNYASTRSPESLARMLVELEDYSGSLPEFELDEEWP